MFNTTSMTGSGIVVYFLVAFLQALGVVDANENDISRYVVNGIEIASYIMMAWGQIRRKDLAWGFWRK